MEISAIATTIVLSTMTALTRPGGYQYCTDLTRLLDEESLLS